MNLVLIGNYLPDRQESMQRFLRLLSDQLISRGYHPEVLRPRTVCGGFGHPHRGLGKWFGYLDKFLLFPITLKKRVKQWRTASPQPTIVHICDQGNAVYTRHLRSLPHLVTCCDLLAIRSALGEIPSHRTRWTGQQLQKDILSGLNRAERITCISDKTRQDLLRLSALNPRQVDVTPMGLNYPYSPMPQAQARASLSSLLLKTNPSLRPSSSTAPYLLHVGGNQWYKNRLGTLRIHAQLCQTSPTPPHLLMAGQPFTPEMNRFVETHGLRDKVVSLPHCTEEELRALYSLAELLLFPSLEEGFGWPIIEAQACGCRVLTTQRPPMTQVGGPAATYLDPDNINASAQQVQAVLLEEVTTRQKRIVLGLANASRFSATEMTDSYTRIYRELACRSQPHSATT